MSKSKVTQKKVTLSELNNHNITNKRQALKDLKMLNFDDIQFKNPAQRRFYKTISTKDITFGIGPAGCGKTYLSVHKALRELGDKDSTIDGIVIVKPLVEAAGEKIGYLPGDVEEKTAPFMMSFYYNMEQIIGKQRLQVLKDSNTIQVIPLAFMRGITLANKFVILDEAQNVSPMQIKTLMTRISNNCKMIMQGDMSQCDKYKTNGVTNYEKSGFYDAWFRLKGVEGVNHMAFNRDDCIRHPLVKRILKTYEDEHEIKLD